MKILYLVTKADLGGAQVHVLDLLRGLRRETDAAVGVGETGYFTDAVRKLGVPYYVLPNLVHPISPLKDCRAVVDVAQLIRLLKPDVVHAHTSKAGVIGRLAARAAGVPSIFTAHTWCFAEGTSLKWRLLGVPAERLAGWLSTAIINVSDANRELALRYRVANPRKILIIWNGIPDTPHRAEPDRDAIPTIAMVARCVDQKDQRLLLRTMAKLAGGVRAVFVGDGPRLSELQEEARKLGVAERVDFVGRRFDVAQILSKAHIFALPTHWEGLPLSILEAMRAGLPVVATDVGGVAEAVVEGQTGFLAARGDDGMFVRRIAELAANPALRRQMGNAGRLRYEASFTLEHMLRNTMTVFRMVALGFQATSESSLAAASASGLPMMNRSPKIQRS
jgi:glycosyltransferase involved in cell wall biosynthesis